MLTVLNLVLGVISCPMSDQFDVLNILCYYVVV